MKLKLTTIFLVLFSITAFGQTDNVVIVTQRPKTVPTGKKWILEVNKPTKVQVDRSVLKSGSRCYALFRSRPNITMNVNKGDIFDAESHGIIFKDVQKMPYTNDYTYELTPISFVDENFELSSLRDNKPEDLGVREIVFTSGESVFVSTCLESIEMREVELTAEEKQLEKQAKDDLAKREASIAENFSIPINTGQHVEKGTKPALKDSLISWVVFNANGVLFAKSKRFGPGFNRNKWTITLTHDKFVMSTNGHDEEYDVLNAKYDDEGMNYQEFQLADRSGKFTHKVQIAYLSDDEEYSVLFSSLDFSDNYQFQEVTLQSIQHTKP